MKTHLPSAVILCASLVLFCVHSFATENQTSLTASPIATSQTSGGSTSSSQGGFVLIPLSSTSVDSQDASLSATEPTIDTQAVETMVVEETTYLSAGQVLDTLFPESDKTWQEGTLTASSPELLFPHRSWKRTASCSSPQSLWQKVWDVPWRKNPKPAPSGCSGQVPSPRHQRILRKISTGSPGPFMRKPATSPWPGESPWEP